MVRSLGKDAHLHRFPDAAHVRGKTGAAGFYEEQPADYLLTTRRNGTRYIEVKSTIDERKFPFSLIKPSQRTAARMILPAGGRYEIFVHSLSLNRWFVLPFQGLESREALKLFSIPWSEMRELTQEDL
ncbi:hypothetical protein SAMN05443249_2746 [Beijerinckia sp. 28-YEA-48]|nr:hypothetical protein SAMN05443249_2746 [Beijerinckia sp. 28-YEA-48]